MMTGAARARVLLVDDEGAVLEGLAQTLRHEPYEIHRAQSGTEALELLGRLTVDLLVSDVRMPHMRGSELLARTAHDRPWIGRVMLTGQLDLETAVRSINEGRVECLLRKPCPPHELKAALAQAL